MTIPSENSTSEQLPLGLDRKEIHSKRVLQAMSRVNRQDFVPSEYRNQANRDSALPIGFEQTISQPFIVAFMSQEADIKPGERVLEIGTGSGYQAAVLAELGAEVYSVEIVPELASEASQRLKRLGYNLVSVRHGDGWKGWAEHAPYDAILVTAVAPQVPPQLLDQLKDQGSIIIPLKTGPNSEEEVLTRVVKSNSEVHETQLLPVRFVPLTGGN